MKSMILQSVSVENFRLLSSVGMELEDLTTVVVGRNNSGKTSLYEVLRRFLDDRSRGFKIEDFSAASYKDFLAASEAFKKGEDEATVRSILPAIGLRLTFKYDPATPDYGALAKFVIDLDIESDQAVAVLEFGLKDGRLDDFFDGLPDEVIEESEKLEFFRTIGSRIPLHYGMRVWAEDPHDESNKRELQGADLAAVLDSGFINAQRGLDDDGYGETDVLGRVLEELFKAASEPNADPKDKGLVEELEKAIQDVQSTLDSNVKGQLDELLPPLNTLGFQALNEAELLTETTLDVVRLLSNFTKIKYSGHSGVALPESYNGLGVRNLILILMRIVSYYKRFRASDKAPGLQVIFIEEPEAHLHPQMQEVFIRKLEKLVQDLTSAEEGGVHWPVQFVVSTHSSHIANEAGFECIRYFLCSRQSDDKSVRSAVIKDLRSGLGEENPSTKKFLHKYLTLTRCDLFFADKAILVEGMSERLMVPVMIEKMSDSEDGIASATSQYTTILEVGGAYAHQFSNLLEFLELKTLIITDIDSVAQENGAGQFKACHVHKGVRTSNGTIKDWFSGDAKCEISDLLEKTAPEKTKANKRIAYQVSDHEVSACGRTFEDAFILANSTKFGLVGMSVEELEIEASEAAGKMKKSEFALQYAIEDQDWVTPTYIEEGLRWLFSDSDATIALMED